MSHLFPRQALLALAIGLIASGAQAQTADPQVYASRPNDPVGAAIEHASMIWPGPPPPIAAQAQEPRLVATVSAPASSTTVVAAAKTIVPNTWSPPASASAAAAVLPVALPAPQPSAPPRPAPTPQVVTAVVVAQPSVATAPSSLATTSQVLPANAEVPEPAEHMEISRTVLPPLTLTVNVRPLPMNVPTFDLEPVAASLLPPPAVVVVPVVTPVIHITPPATPTALPAPSIVPPVAMTKPAAHEPVELPAVEVRPSADAVALAKAQGTIVALKDDLATANAKVQTLSVQLDQSHQQTQAALAQVDNQRGLTSVALHQEAAAAQSFVAAAQHGDPTAKANLALMLIQGKAIQQDIPRAIALLEEAAGQGNAMAARNLSSIYRVGIGVLPDIEQASRWELTARRIEEGGQVVATASNP